MTESIENKRLPFICAISGVKNSGKTTLIEKLLPLLIARGHQVAVIKHDGHGFVPDAPGTDTFRFRQAGAYGTVVYDQDQFMLVKKSGSTPKQLSRLFPEADIILIEGGKYSPYPKFEIVRAGNSTAPVCEPSTLLGLVTDLPLRLPGVPTIPMDDVASLARIILERKEQTRE